MAKPTRANVTSGNNAGTSTWTTASVTPTANRLHLFWLFARTANASCAQPSGCNLTFSDNAIASVNYTSFGSISVNLSVWAAIGASPSSGTVSGTYSGGPSQIAWWWDEWTASTTIADLVAYTNTGSDNSLELASAMTAFATDSVVCASGGQGSTTAPTLTAETNWTELYNYAYSVRDKGIIEWYNGEDTSPTISSGTTANWAMIALEIKAAAAAAGQPLVKRYGQIPHAYSLGKGVF